MCIVALIHKEPLNLKVNSNHEITTQKQMRKTYCSLINPVFDIREIEHLFSQECTYENSELNLSWNIERLVLFCFDLELKN